MLILKFNSNSVTIANLSEILFSAESKSSSNNNGYSFDEVYTNWIEMIKNEMYTYLKTAKKGCNLRVSKPFWTPDLYLTYGNNLD